MNTEDKFYFGKHGQPERFAGSCPDEKAKFTLSDVILDAMSVVQDDEPRAASWVNEATKAISRYRKTMKPDEQEWIQYKKLIALANQKGLRIGTPVTLRASRPGQPERFDASSLDRKGFAAASSSPMLGKLLSEKQMPEGGWRAVETGGGALVISFEDGDVAGNFARRVASHGYSATAPVQSIGRYWNVEVKNGK